MPAQHTTPRQLSAARGAHAARGLVAAASHEGEETQRYGEPKYAGRAVHRSTADKAPSTSPKVSVFTPHGLHPRDQKLRRVAGCVDGFAHAKHIGGGRRTRPP